MQVRVGDIVKVKSEQGDPGIVQVVKMEGAGSRQEAEVRYLESNRTRRLYTAHLYSDTECHRLTLKARQERANKIGKR